MQWPIYARLGMLNGLMARTDASGPAALELYEDPQPVSLGDASAQEPLAVLALAHPSGSVYAAGPLADDLAVWSLVSEVGFATTSGQVGWAQIVAADGAVVMRGTAGSADQIPTPDFIVSSSVVYQGGELTATGAITL